jgi:hypothetical protein
MENKEEKYYVRSNGEKVSLKTMNTEHIINALAKKQREIFNSANKDETSQYLKEINDLKEEYHRRFNEFYDGLGDK